MKWVRTVPGTWRLRAAEAAGPCWEAHHLGHKAGRPPEEGRKWPPQGPGTARAPVGIQSILSG